MQLNTPRLVLREFRLSDLPSFAVYHQNPQYLAHYDGPPDTERIVRLAIAWAAEQPRANYQLVIAESDTTPALGSVGLRGKGQTSGVAEFGFELNPAFWGRGYAREAGQALLEFGFQTLRLRRVISPTTSGNRRAHHLLEALGFTREAIPNHSGLVQFSLSSRDR